MVCAVAALYSTVEPVRFKVKALVLAKVVLLAPVNPFVLLVINVPVMFTVDDAEGVTV